MAAATLSVIPACTSVGSPLSARAGQGVEAYVAVFADPAQPGTDVARVDVADGTVDRPLRTTVSEPAAVAAVPGTDTVVAVGSGDDQLVQIDAATGAVVRRVTVGLEPDAVAVTPDGATALVADSGSGRLTVVDLRTGRVRRTLPVGPVPAAVAVGGRRGSIAVVVDEQDGNAVPVILHGLRVFFAIAVGSEPDAVAVTPGATTALVADLGADTVTPLDLTTGIVGAAIPVGVPPTGLAVTTHPAPGTDRAADPDGTAWVSGGASLVPIDLATMTAGPPLTIGRPAEAVALTADGTRAWVADQDATVTEVDLVTGRILRTLPVGGRPTAIVIPR